MASHPNVAGRHAHEHVRIDRGPLKGDRLRLGPLVGTRAVGLSHYRLGPGERAMPVHVHADEEELFFLLAGSGLSWQDGTPYPARAGDIVCHRAGAGAHPLIAGDEGLEYLAFGGGSRPSIPPLPRAGAWWLGSHWLPAD